MAYAAPAALVVGVFFLVPLVLVLWMSLHEWPLIGEPTLNLPNNYTGIADNPLFVDAVLFTLKYTVIVTIVLFTSAFGLALLVQRRRPGVGLFRTAFFLPGAVGFATASLLFYGLLPLIPCVLAWFAASHALPHAVQIVLAIMLVLPIAPLLDRIAWRSEERRVGKECWHVCRSRWSPYH